MRAWAILWPVIILVEAFLFRAREWEWFYFIALAATVAYVFLPMQCLRGRKLAWGAIIMLATYMLSVWFLEVMDYSAALIPHSIVNTLASLGFLVITVLSRGIWAATCCAIHAGMVVLAYWYHGHSDTMSLLGFQEALNALFLAALATICLAKFAGEQRWGERVDGFLSRFTGLSFTGLRDRRLYLDRAED